MMERPAYIYASGSPIQHTPMHLDEAEMYGFLIKGDGTKLQATVDATLNKVGAGQITFRVLSPYILLTFTRVNHAQSGFPADHERGWGKECDIIPWIMVGQMEESGGTEKLHRVFAHPSYTWVDVPMAVSIGREVFGYPKNICQVDMPDVGDDPVTFAITCEGWQPFGAQTQLGMQRFLEITAANTDNPHVSVPGLQGVILEGFKLLKSAPDLLSLDAAGIADLESLLLRPHIDQLFLKQFPDTSGVKAVYQAVVVAPATIDKVRSAELLGYVYECTLHRFDSYRLDKTLGLQLGAQPVLLPFHISMNFTVEAGEELAETTACTAGASDGSAQTAATEPQQNASGEAQDESLQASAARPTRIAILGGGIGAMTAAFYLTDPHAAGGPYDITVYQMGWRLGGKCASGRNAKIADRIEEHGLHIWFGFYNNGFDLMKNAYGALNCPAGHTFATWKDAFKRQDSIVLTETFGTVVKFWPIEMPERPGEPGGQNPEVTMKEMAKTLKDWTRQWRSDIDARLLVLTGGSVLEDIGEIPEGCDELLQNLGETFPLSGEDDPTQTIDCLRKIRADIYRRASPFLATDDKTRRLFICIDLALTTLIGMLVDGVMSNNFDVINGHEFSSWLAINGAQANTVRSAPVCALYDLVFAFEGGDPKHPNIEAGTMLRGMLRLLIDYRGGFMWKMQAGMGDTVFTPLYEVLHSRGVKFEFFHKVEDLIAVGDSVEEIVLTQQVALKAAAKEYCPLVNVLDLDCWPNCPKYDLLDPTQAQLLQANGVDLESHWNQWEQIYSAEFGKPLPQKRLKRGVCFDKIILGLPVGSLPYACPSLLTAGSPLKEVADNVKTAATQAYQVWLSKNLKDLGWNEFSSRGEVPVLSAFSEPFDTSAYMSQLLPRETWPTNCEPKSIFYFCSRLPLPAVKAPGQSFPAACAEAVHENALKQLQGQVYNLWPHVADAHSFDWSVLIDQRNRTGPARFDSQYWRANVDPSELYVLSVVNSTKHRITSDGSGPSNLYLAGDWLKTGLNAGCVEAAVMGGMQASRAICGYPAVIRGETDQ
jgi:uncharacterized protein with NAD-binding domain and iron-sulfur cluster